jgi:hypothetical protein
MQYYSLHCAATKIGRGGFPQAQKIEMEEGRKVTDDDFVWNLPGDRFPDFQPYTGTLILQKGSTVTDFISAAIISTGFVCSDKARNIIEEHRMGNTKFYELGIKHRDIYYSNYQFMHPVNNYVDRVDFDKSVFHIQRLENNHKIGKIQPLANPGEFIELSKKLSKNGTYGDWQCVEPITIRFKNNFQPEHDIFLIWGLTYKTFVSEKLRAAFEKNKVTGIMFDYYGEHTDFE